MIYNVDVCIEMPIRDTEITDRIGNTTESIFPGVELDREPGQPVGEIHRLEHFSERLHEQAILDAARHGFAKRRDDDGFSLALKKQVASKGVVSFSVGNPNELGNIEVHVTVRDPSADEAIDYVAPPTEEGRPVDPNDR